MQKELQQFKENEELRSQNRELQTMVSHQLHMWKISEEEREALCDLYLTTLQVEALVDIKPQPQRDILMKELDESVAQLTKRYEESLELITAKAKSTQSTCKLIIRKCEDEAKTAREELELCRAQIGMEETRIKVLIDKHCQ